MKEKKMWHKDVSAGIVVYLVALPLCLGIGLASTNVEGISGLPSLFSGLIAGIVGGIVVGFISGSRLGVSGPAAGLITIILAAILTLGSWEAFLLAVFISGIIQIISGLLKIGIIANYVPGSVIKGMLAAIGITLILKEIPHLVGYDADFFGDDAFIQQDGHNTFSELFYSINALHPGATFIGILSLIGMVLYNKISNKLAVLKFIPGALVFVLLATLINGLVFSHYDMLFIDSKHLVQIPVSNSMEDFIGYFKHPDFTAISNPDVYVIAFTLALVGSLETLLSVEATDKLDPQKNTTPRNRELVAQGFGNAFSGLLGGLPVTQVIVRSSANVTAGGFSKASTIIHGFLLLISIIFLGSLINLIPLAVLAAVLILVGYKLASLDVFRKMYAAGLDQFIPFIATIAGVLLTDLLKGIGIGLVVAIFYILKRNHKNNFELKSEESGTVHIHLSEEVTFLNKSGIKEMLENIEQDKKLVMDGSKCKNIDFDVKEVIKEFIEFKAPRKNIDVEIKNIELN